MPVLFLSDLDISMRGRTFTDPEGGHCVLGTGRDLAAALEHLSLRSDCWGLGLLSTPDGPWPAELPALHGRRLLMAMPPGDAASEFAVVAGHSGAEIEWPDMDESLEDGLRRWALPVVALVLAAGAGSRMGSQKLLLELGGKSLVVHAIEAAADGGCHAVWVVYADRAVREATAHLANAVHNPDAATGMASSLRAGLAALPAWTAGALVLLGDQPMIGPGTVAKLLARWREEASRPAVAASHRGTWRPPVVLGRELWPELMELDGDMGARQVLGARPELVETLSTPASAAGESDLDEGADVDTPDDYRRILRLHVPRGS